jgi:hypothetical protein
MDFPHTLGLCLIPQKSEENSAPLLQDVLPIKNPAANSASLQTFKPTQASSSELLWRLWQQFILTSDTHYHHCFQQYQQLRLFEHSDTLLCSELLTFTDAL